MLIRSFAAAAVLALSSLAALPASAQVNESTTVQMGGVNTSTTDQRGTDNHAKAVQIGDDNLAGIVQWGSKHNKAECGQAGAINDCAVVQRNRQGK